MGGLRDTCLSHRMPEGRCLRTIQHESVLEPALLCSAATGQSTFEKLYSKHPFTGGGLGHRVFHQQLRVCEKLRGASHLDLQQISGSLRELRSCVLYLAMLGQLPLMASCRKCPPGVRIQESITHQCTKHQAPGTKHSHSPPWTAAFVEASMFAREASSSSCWGRITRIFSLLRRKATLHLGRQSNPLGFRKATRDAGCLWHIFAFSLWLKMTLVPMFLSVTRSRSAVKISFIDMSAAKTEILRELRQVGKTCNGNTENRGGRTKS